MNLLLFFVVRDDVNDVAYIVISTKMSSSHADYFWLDDHEKLALCLKFHLFYSRYSLLTSKTRQNIEFMTGLQNNSNNSDEMLETVFFGSCATRI